MRNIYIVFFLFILFLISCRKNKIVGSASKDMLSHIVIPEWMCDSSILNAEYTESWIPYPVLKLDRKSLEEVKEIYGEPSELLMDTFLYGDSKNNKFGELTVDTMLSKIPSAEIYLGSWYLGNALLKLYFINNERIKTVFYGYQFNPYRIMME